MERFCESQLRSFHLPVHKPRSISCFCCGYAWTPLSRNVLESRSVEGATVFDPKQIKFLDPQVGLQPADCVWGHDLVELARKLAVRRPDFDLGKLMETFAPWVQDEPLTVENGFELFDPFFTELRYPQELKTMGGVGDLDKLLLDELVERLQPFLAKIK